MKENNLCEAITRIAWGYILLHIDFKLNTIDILPSWLGYLLFLSALSAIGEEEESAKLLQPLGSMMVVLELVTWFNKGFMENYFELKIISVFAGVISLYFHFQLLTNLAEIARRYECSQEKRLLSLRTVKTVLATIFTLIITFEIDSVVSYVLLIVFLIVTIWICKILFDFKKELENKFAMEKLGEEADL